MKVFIGADHRGFELKERLKAWLSSEGYDVTDCGNTVYDKDDDYPDFSFAVADRLVSEGLSRSTPGVEARAKGIVICGSGVGVTIAANKVRGIRCSPATSEQEITRGVADDDLNVLAISADYVGKEEAKTMITAFLTASFVGDTRHVRRLKKIEERELHNF